MWHFIILLLLCFIPLAASHQAVSIELLSSSGFSNSGLPVAVSVGANDLNGVSTSVLMAESWLKTNVLAHFPSTKISTILVGDTDDGVLCLRDQSWGFLLPCLKNVHYSLTRWGLEREIKVSVFLSYNCFTKFPNPLNNEALLQFFHTTNSTLSLNLPPPPNAMSFSSTYPDIMKKLAFFNLNKINLLVTTTTTQDDEKPLNSRKLSSIESVKPYPANLPIHSSIGFSTPATIPKTPTAKLPHSVSLPPLSFPHDAPPPMHFPRPSPAPYDGFTLPPCAASENAAPAPAPAPAIGVGFQRLWCVAKPSVPQEILQEAMDYACGDGGAKCDEIMPQGSCFYPNTIVAHASYAINSYWQNTKGNGGTCSFGDTAMLINADPSFLHCRFLLS